MTNNEKVVTRSETTEISHLQPAAAADGGVQSDSAEPKHVPGPWSVVTDEFNERQREGICASVMHTRTSVFLAEVWSDFELDDTDGDFVGIPQPGTGLANAHLIAAAPDLLAAAQEAWEELAQCRQNDDVDRVMNQLHAAITKALGAQ